MDVLSRLDKLREKKENIRRKMESEQNAGGFAGEASARSNESRYERIEEIGKGGMGVIYKARDKVLDRVIALKVLYASLQKNKKIIDTFVREAKSAAALNHLNIVTIFDAGIEKGSYYIAMEYIEGNTMREIVKKKPLSIPQVLGILKQVCRGLIYAHSKHIVHRDLTTNNIMLSKKKVVKIMDFGLARVIRDLLSEQSIIGGTPSYMSPEQVEGDPIDHRTDIYTLGVTLFEMTTGELPFKEGNIGFHHLNTMPPVPNSLRPEIPAFLNDIIVRCMQKKREDRYQSVSELLMDIQE
jgi:serine/threonine-protein kinase